jgi:hypothetical protein
MKPLGFYASAVAEHPDETILDRITEDFGPQLQSLSRDDKAAVLICLVDAAVNPQQVLIQDNFFSDRNGGELWQLAQRLTPASQLNLALAIMNYLVHGGQR